MRRPNKRQRKKNAKRDGAWIKQPAGRPRKFRKTRRGHPSSAPVTGKWKTIPTRLTFRAPTDALRAIEADVNLTREIMRQRRGSLRKFIAWVRADPERARRYGGQWARSPIYMDLLARYGE